MQSCSMGSLGLAMEPRFCFFLRVFPSVLLESETIETEQVIKLENVFLILIMSTAGGTG